MNNLDHVMKNDTKNKYQRNDTIEYDPKSDGKFIFSIGTRDPPPLPQ